MDTEIACFRFGNVHVIPVTCPAIAQEFLKKQDAVFALRPLSVAAGTFSGGYKTTILSPYEETWKKMRKRYFVEKIIDDGAPTSREEERVEALFEALRYLYAFCMSDSLPYLAGLDLDGHEKIIKEVHETILKYHEPIIRERIQKWSEDDGRNFLAENELGKIEPSGPA
ncbi:hypothetical protein CDL15_Pgr018006 [Punica granatum]|uniref:Uncharacterized protein n=1 Tax=Punica granatum TaxID=22663 RepID=A0A218WHT9_PUNGR|nr:hypothetical protein CDL15_Pgr018006 [Punica granatum]